VLGMNEALRDTLRTQAPPKRSPGEEVKSELARLRAERDQAVRRYKLLIRGAEFAAVVAIAAMFWWAVLS